MYLPHLPTADSKGTGLSTKQEDSLLAGGGAVLQSDVNKQTKKSWTTDEVFMGQEQCFLLETITPLGLDL